MKGMLLLSLLALLGVSMSYCRAERQADWLREKLYEAWEQEERRGWKPRVAEFVDAGLAQAQAEALCAGLRHLKGTARMWESAAEAAEEIGGHEIDDRIVLAMAPMFAELIKEKRIGVEWSEKVTGPDGPEGDHDSEGADSSIEVVFHSNGSLSKFSFTASNLQGQLILDVPPSLSLEELMVAMERKAEERLEARIRAIEAGMKASEENAGGK